MTTMETTRVREGSPVARGRRSAPAAEWMKLRTLHSTWWLLAAIPLLTVLLGAAATGAADTDHCRTPTSCDEDLVRLALSGVQLSQAAVAILAVLAVSSEYGTGTIRATLAAVPDRLRVLAAKAAAVVPLTAAAGTVGVLLSVAAGRPILESGGFTRAHGYAQLSLTDGATARAAFGTVLYLVLIALLSLGLAFLLRDTAGTITAVLGLLYAFPIIASLVSDDDWREWLIQASPSSAGQSIQSTRALDTLAIAPWPGLGVLALYTAGTLLLGAWALHRRDA